MLQLKLDAFHNNDNSSQDVVDSLTAKNIELEI
jgi:hypothetical protein